MCVSNSTANIHLTLLCVLFYLFYKTCKAKGVLRLRTRPLIENTFPDNCILNV